MEKIEQGGMVGGVSYVVLELVRAGLWEVNIWAKTEVSRTNFLKLEALIFNL